MAIQVDVYEDTRGIRPFEDWFNQLPAAYAAKVTKAVARLGLGNRSGLKSVGEGVFEWRIDWGPGIRIYVAFDGARLIILLGGGTKNRQQADIDEARQRWVNYKQRKTMKE